MHLIFGGAGEYLSPHTRGIPIPMREDGIRDVWLNALVCTHM